jgi:hypothetical protein
MGAKATELNYWRCLRGYFGYFMQAYSTCKTTSTGWMMIISHGVFFFFFLLFPAPVMIPFAAPFSCCNSDTIIGLDDDGKAIFSFTLGMSIVPVRFQGRLHQH